MCVHRGMQVVATHLVGGHVCVAERDARQLHGFRKQRCQHRARLRQFMARAAKAAVQHARPEAMPMPGHAPPAHAKPGKQHQWRNQRSRRGREPALRHRRKGTGIHLNRRIAAASKRGEDHLRKRVQRQQRPHGPQTLADGPWQEQAGDQVPQRQFAEAAELRGIDQQSVGHLHGEPVDAGEQHEQRGGSKQFLARVQRWSHPPHEPRAQPQGHGRSSENDP